MGALARRLADQVAAPWSVQAVLHDMHEAAGAASYYAVIRGGDVVVAHLDACPDHPGDGAPRVGEPAPAHALAAGKVLLAWLDRRRLADVLATPLPAFTPGTVTDRAMLDRELRRCRELGSAVEVEELRPDRAGMASPVRGPGGAVVGAVALSVSRVELMARWSELERVVRDGAARAGAGLSRPVAVG
jgi:DNA-binding IclR family transcriptional regulator